MPASIADEFLDAKELTQSTKQPKVKYSEHQIPLTRFNQLLNDISESQDANISLSSSQTYYANVANFKTPPAQIQRSLVSGLENISILDPSSVKPRKTEHYDEAFLFGTFDKVDDNSIAFLGNLNIQKLQVSDGRKLPLNFGPTEIRIQSPTLAKFQQKCSWNLSDDLVQIIRVVIDENHEGQLLVIVGASKTAALVAEGEKLTLEKLLAIKKDLPAEPTLAVASNSTAPNVPILAEDSSSRALDADALTEPSKPLSLLLQCGETDKKRSLNTKIGLANNATITVEGEVVSQQISVESVQVSGRNFVFKNEEEGSFSAAAASGSISFNRVGPLEDTLRLSLRSNAKLQFAGVEFSADSIECYPDRIEANGNVNVSIPEISSNVSAGRVIMDLKSLAFDFDGNVEVRRNVGDDSFPFLLKGKHVGWSLVTGEMQTDVRYCSPNRSAGQTNGFSQVQSKFGASRSATHQPQQGRTPFQTYRGAPAANQTFGGGN